MPEDYADMQPWEHAAYLVLAVTFLAAFTLAAGLHSAWRWVRGGK